MGPQSLGGTNIRSLRLRGSSGANGCRCSRRLPGSCFGSVTRYIEQEATPDESKLAEPAERMRMMRRRRRAQGLRELRLVVPDARSEAVRNRIAAQVAELSPQSEREALLWIEAVSEFDADEPR